MAKLKDTHRREEHDRKRQQRGTEGDKYMCRKLLQRPRLEEKGRGAVGREDVSKLQELCLQATLQPGPRN